MSAPRVPAVAGRPYDRELLVASAPEAAVALLGALLVRETDAGRVVARIVETEAYDQHDPASHSFRGRTDRTRPMFGVAGGAYVYRSYGVHWCLNVTVDEPDHGAAVLLRAARIELGEEHVRARRPHLRRSRDLLRGPGRLCAGLDITGPLHGGGDLLDGVAGLQLREGDRPDAIAVGPRVGVSEAADVPWRFWIAGAPEVSAYRRSPRARPAS